MKLLSHRVHGTLDYVLVAALLLAPWLLQFSPAAAAVGYLIAAAHLLMSLLTDTSLSLAKLIPFQVHGAIEFSMGVGLVAAPWLFGFSGSPMERAFFVGAGLFLIAAVMTTRYAAKTWPSREPFDRYGSD